VLLVGHRAFKRIGLESFLHKAVVDAVGLLSRPSVSMG
jgi:hypothetical protein